MRSLSRIRSIVSWVAALVLASYSMTLAAQWAKEPTSGLDQLAFQRPELRVVETPTDLKALSGQVLEKTSYDAFRAENGIAWRITLDARRGVPTLVDGGAIPFIPGTANTLAWQDFAAGCTEYRCLPVRRVEELARAFLNRYPEVFKVDPAELVLDPLGSGPVGASLYFLRFQWVHGGIPVEGGSVYFRINGGNLIQVATENIGPIDTCAVPSISVETAGEIVRGYLGAFTSDKDRFVEAPYLVLLPVTPRGKDPNVFDGPVGSMLDFALAYRFTFEREGVMGRWEALVDAHSGEILRFMDTAKYGQVQGTVYPSDGHVSAGIRPLPFVRTDLPAPNDYADAAGRFPGESATVTLSQGKVAWIADSCGSTSLATTDGNADYGTSVDTDCGVPSPNPAGEGNTWAGKTLYYNVTMINAKARTYMPSNAWLNSGHVTIKVNQPPQCNAFSGGGTIYFYKATPTCWNLGELPGVCLHEWGHAMDDYDGSGGESSPAETRADWTAILQTHDSCAGRGALKAGNCSKYGNPCTNCSGARDADRMQHANTELWTPANEGTVFSCGGSGSYNGPCGWKDHCESGIASQALWDLVHEGLIVASGVDMATAWQIVDRLFYAGMPTLGKMYTCTPPTSDGCNGGSLYNAMRAVDDVGDGTANGTPHAAAIFFALDRHGIGCGVATELKNYNQPICPTISKPVLAGAAGNNAAHLTWTASTNAARYVIFRNDTGCDAGYTKVGEVSAPVTSFEDGTAVNGLTSFYRVQALAESDSCFSLMSNCVSVVPQPCLGAITLDKPILNCAETVEVTLSDDNVPAFPSTVDVLAWSTTDPAPKTVTLTNTPPGSASYVGSFATTTSATPLPSEVRVSDGATVTVHYLDEDFCGTPVVDVDRTAAVDCAAPAISNVQAVNVTAHGADITWDTDEAADGTVTYDTMKPPAAQTATVAAQLTSHILHLTGLDECTRHFFSVRSADPGGNVAEDSNGGSYFEFTTSKDNHPAYARVEDPPLVIPSGNPAGATSTLHVADARAIQDVTVKVNMSHPWGEGITLYLIGPDATQVTLSQKHGAMGGDYTGTVFDDAAATPIASGFPPFTGTFRPDQPLAAFDGKSAAGAWGFKVVDDSSGSAGHILDWSLTFTFSPQACPDDLAVDVTPSGTVRPCLAQDLTLKAKVVGSQGAVTYQWTRDGGDIPGANTDKITENYATAQSHSYNCKVTDTVYSNVTDPASTLSDWHQCTPDLQYDEAYDPKGTMGELCADWDMVLEPGEKWQVKVRLKNVGDADAGNVTADLAVNAGSAADAMIEGNPGAFGTIAKNGGTAIATYSFTVSVDAVCVSDLVFDVTAITSSAGGFPSEVPAFSMPVGVNDPGSDQTAIQSPSAISTTLGASYADFTPLFLLPSADAATVSYLLDYQSALDANPLAPEGTVTANVKVELVDPSDFAWVLKEFGAADANPYNVGGYYSGPGTYRLRLSENAGGIAGLSAGGMHVTKGANVQCDISSCGPQPLLEAAPGDTRASAQDWLDKDSTRWPPLGGATSYTLYRGDRAGLPNLVGSRPDSCVRYQGGATEALADDDPALADGGFFWYLVTGSDASSEGLAGTGAAGQRTVNSTGPCT